jgi:outer membrane protein assembly factor BamB
LYVPVNDRQGAVYFKRDQAYRRGKMFLGGSAVPLPGGESRTFLKAVNPRSGAIVWATPGATGPSWGGGGGVLSTAAGLVFWGDNSEFYALDARTGQRLWTVNLGGRIIAAPMTYAVDGQQRITLAAGSTVFTFGLPQ